MTITGVQLDRAVGSVLASAVGDALGSQYEFRTRLTDDERVEYGVGTFGHAVGEWTDDTSMAMPILRALAEGRSLDDPATLAGIVAAWREWMRTAKDVGIQTRSVLSQLSGRPDEDAARTAAESIHVRQGRSGGNGALMRTGPVALGYLDASPAELAAAAGRIARLTHWEQDNADACALWSLAIRHAVLTGELDVHGQVEWLPSERQDRWRRLIDEALAPGAQPVDFAAQNGWVVAAFQGALAAVASSTSPLDALERAIRGGNDTDTVAAIAGALAGAIYGGSAIPLGLKRRLHGWPGIDANELVRRAALAARAGSSDSQGWPRGEYGTTYRRSDYLALHPHDDGVYIGSIAALRRLPHEVGAVVSLCRVGTRDIPNGVESVQVWLVDEDGQNANLDSVLAGAADAVAELRSEGRTVFVHCAEGRSRTSAVATLYGVRHRGVPLDRAWDDIAEALPGFAPQRFLCDAVERITAD
jgi:ADP-ribosylglycohydrolase